LCFCGRRPWRPSSGPSLPRRQKSLPAIFCARRPWRPSSGPSLPRRQKSLPAIFCSNPPTVRESPRDSHRFPFICSKDQERPMSAQILDGKALAQRFEQEMSQRVEALKAASGGRTPILATILVGTDPASATYVKMKGNACRRVGMDSQAIELPQDTTTEQLLQRIEELNANPDVHGIL